MVTEIKLDFGHLQGKEKIISNVNSLTHHEPAENTNLIFDEEVTVTR